MARKILLADDSVTAQNMGRKILADAGYEVTTVNNGSAALKKIGEQKPDLIVLDVYMPGYSGLEVCQRLKETAESSRIPVLLTVGKLEPFKPEEAKRARADAFIVKPFEASELLSALSKLEDKIVPRAEASKPGRFARANAALDQGHYDKSMAIEEDSGWKNRIAFPAKNKKSEEPHDVDDVALYNPVNKDLRMVVERKPADKPREVKAEAQTEPQTEVQTDVQKRTGVQHGDSRVDLGALVPEGLPKDVTAEEIAALAAAAAQMKSKIEEKSGENRIEGRPAERTDEAGINRGDIDQASIDQASIREGKFAESVAVQPARAAAAEIRALDRETTDAKPEELPSKAATVAEPQPVTMPVPLPALAGQKLEEKIEAAQASEISKTEAPRPAEVVAALTGSPEEPGRSHSTNQDSWALSADHRDREPVTMAVAAGAESHGSSSRWTAVAVALDPEDAAVSLENEMQKTHAAFAAAEVGHARSFAPAPETQPAAAPPAPEKNEDKDRNKDKDREIAASSPAAESPADPVVAVPVLAEPYAGPVPSASASTATETAAKEDAATHVDGVLSAVAGTVVRLFEKVAGSHSDAKEPTSPAQEPAPLEASEVSTQPMPTASQTIEVQNEPNPTALPATPTPETTALASAHPSEPETRYEQPANEQPRIEAAKHEDSKQENRESEDWKNEGWRNEVRSNEARSNEAGPNEAGSSEDWTSAAFKNQKPHSDPPTPADAFAKAAAEATGKDVEKDESTTPSLQNESATQQISARQESSDRAAQAASDHAAGGTEDMAKKESDIAATTAAAWASWRRIRETADPKTASSRSSEKDNSEKNISEDSGGMQSDQDASASQDKAAMAVAAGAEKSPREAPSSEDSGEIASIVDSVLADLRPKIVEEISKKMKKK